MQNLIDINDIQKANAVDKTDKTIINKKLLNLNAYIAKKMLIDSLSCRYDSTDNLYIIDSFIDSIIYNISAELGTFLSIETANSLYIKDIDIKNLNNLLLTKEYAKSYLMKYATINDANALNEQCSENRFKLMEEMTDFAAAGAINVQSSGGSEDDSSGTGDNK